MLVSKLKNTGALTAKTLDEPTKIMSNSSSKCEFLNQDISRYGDIPIVSFCTE